MTSAAGVRMCGRGKWSRDIYTFDQEVQLIVSKIQCESYPNIQVLVIWIYVYIYSEIGWVFDFQQSIKAVWSEIKSRERPGQQLMEMPNTPNVDLPWTFTSRSPPNFWLSLERRSALFPVMHLSIILPGASQALSSLAQTDVATSISTNGNGIVHTGRCISCMVDWSHSPSWRSISPYIARSTVRALKFLASSLPAHGVAAGEINAANGLVLMTF